MREEDMENAPHPLLSFIMVMLWNEGAGSGRLLDHLQQFYGEDEA